MAIAILVVLWIVLGLVAAALAPRIFRKPAPFGQTAEYVICVVTVVVIGLVDWLWAFPLFGISGPLAFVGALVEPFLAAWVVLWILRQVRQPSPTA